MNISTGLAFISGILILISGIVTIAYAFSIFGNLSINYNALFGLGILGIACGIMIVYLSSLIRRRTENEIKKIGIFILIFTLLSAFNGGGFIIGFILGIIASASFISFRKEQANIEQVQ